MQSGALTALRYALVTMPYLIAPLLGLLVPLLGVICYSRFSSISKLMPKRAAATK